MATYAIGDIQGCFDEFQRLLTLVSFDSNHDHLWLTGDLVNRGPESLKVLRAVRNLGNRCTTVLGNHDLHLIARRYLPGRKVKAGDTLDEVLAAPDCDELLDWLRHRPLLHHDETLGYTLIHAGLAPSWTLAQAKHCASEVEDVLRAKHFKMFLQEMYGNEPSRWRVDLAGNARLRFILNCFTRARYCSIDGKFNLKAKGELGAESPELLPWFMIPERATQSTSIIIGHWSTLRIAAEVRDKFHIYPLDTGAVWGGELTAMRLDDKKIFAVKAATAAALIDD